MIPTGVAIFIVFGILRWLFPLKSKPDIDEEKLANLQRKFVRNDLMALGLMFIFVPTIVFIVYQIGQLINYFERF